MGTEFISDFKGERIEEKPFGVETQKLIDEVLGYEVMLDKDPSKKNLATLYNKQSECYNYMVRIGKVYTRIITTELAIQVAFQTMEKELKLKIENSMLSDDDVKLHKNQDLREAAARQKSEEFEKKVDILETQMLKIKTFKEIIGSKMRELDKCLDTLSRQISVIGEIIGRPYLGGNSDSEDNKIRLKTV